MPVPLASPPGSALPFHGYAAHSMTYDHLTMTQVSTWFDDSCAALGDVPLGEVLFDLLFLYGAVAPSEKDLPLPLPDPAPVPRPKPKGTAGEK